MAVGQPDWTGFWPGIARGIEAGARVPAPVRSLAGIERRRLAVASAFAAALLAVTIWQAGDSPRMLSEGSTALAIAETEVPDGSVMVYSPPGDDMTVIWVFGAENHAAGAI